MRERTRAPGWQAAQRLDALHQVLPPLEFERFRLVLQHLQTEEQEAEFLRVLETEAMGAVVEQDRIAGDATAYGMEADDDET